jgi:hypothetical protein
MGRVKQNEEKVARSANGNDEFCGALKYLNCGNLVVTT